MPSSKQIEIKTKQTKTEYKIIIGVIMLGSIIAAAGIVGGLLLDLPETQLDDSTSTEVTEVSFNFSDVYGFDWIAEWTEDNEFITKLSLGSLPVTSIDSTVTSITADNIDAVSKKFISDNVSLFNIQTDDLTLRNSDIDPATEEISETAYIHYNQKYNDIPVYNGIVTLVYADNELIVFDSGYQLSEDINTTPKVDQEIAEQIARSLEATGQYIHLQQKNKLPEDMVQTPNILNTATPTSPENVTIKNTALSIHSSIVKKDRLAWQIELEHIDNASKPLYFIDAIDGTLLNREEQTNLAPFYLDGYVTGSVYSRYPSYETQPIEDLSVYWQSIAHETDDQGYYRGTYSGNTDFILQAYLEGPYAKVDLTHSKKIIVLSVPEDITYSWDWGYNYNLYYYLNEAHDFFTAGGSFDAPVDYQVQAHVDSDTCGGICTSCSSSPDIWFSPGAKTDAEIPEIICHSTALSSDVMYHEYAHVVAGEIAPSIPQTVDEALAYYWAATINDDPMIADEIFPDGGVPPMYLTNLDNDYQFPYSCTYGDPSIDHMCLGGALWDFKEYTEDYLHTTTPDHYIIRTEKMNPQSETDFLQKLVSQINFFPKTLTCRSFAKHGIYVSECASHTQAHVSYPDRNIIGPSQIEIIGTVNKGESESYTIEYMPSYWVDPNLSWSDSGVTLTGGDSIIDDVIGTIDHNYLSDGWNTIKLAIIGAGEVIQEHYVRFVYSSNLKTGWPVTTEEAGADHFSAPALYDLNGNGNKEVIYYDGNALQVRDSAGQLLWNKPFEAPAFVNPAVADIDDDGYPEIVVLAGSNIFVWDKDGNEKWSYQMTQSSWPNPEVESWTTPAIAEIDGQSPGREIIVVGAHIGGAPTTLKNYILSSFGEVLTSWQIANDGNYNYFEKRPSPAIGDVDGDESNGSEIVATYNVGNSVKVYTWDQTGNEALPLKQLTGQAIASPVIADINEDGLMDIIQLTQDVTPGGSNDNVIHAWDKNGDIWSITLPNEYYWHDAEPMVVDLDPLQGNGLETIMGRGSAALYIWDKNGNKVGEAHATGDVIDTAAVVVDVDNDSDLEIFIGSEDGGLYGWHHNGTAVAGFPQFILSNIHSTPSIDDIDQDGQLEIAAGFPISEYMDGGFAVWDLNTTYNDDLLTAPTYRYNTQRTGNVLSPKDVYVDVSNTGDPDEDGSSDHPFDLIQEGIDAANMGSVVRVSPGIYLENIELKSEVPLIGSGASYTKIDGRGGGGSVIEAVYDSNVSISGFHITNSTNRCVYINRTSNFGITNNVISNCGIGISSSTSNGIIANNSIINSGSSTGGAILGYNSTLTIKNNILANTQVSDARGIELPGSTHDISYNNMWGHAPAYVNIPDQTGLNGNISENPLFVGPPNYHLDGSSPCIDAGDPNDDYSREPQPNGERINMGAHGNTSEAESSDSNLLYTISGGDDYTFPNGPYVTIPIYLDTDQFANNIGKIKLILPRNYNYFLKDVAFKLPNCSTSTSEENYCGYKKYSDHIEILIILNTLSLSPGESHYLFSLTYGVGEFSLNIPIAFDQDNSVLTDTNNQDILSSHVSYIPGIIWEIYRDRGDINLNDIPYEISDAVLLSNYFIFGPEVFTEDPTEQAYQSDTDADCITVEVEDLELLNSIIAGDQEPTLWWGCPGYASSTATCPDGTAIAECSASGQFCFQGELITKGDINEDNRIDPIDVVYLVNYFYRGMDLEDKAKAAANVNGDLKVDSEDLNYLVNYVYRGGPEPTCQ
ncbi:dockerin type I domain-containing protein [Patescibacteria group bacterium]